jgi:hypothetical protein
MAEVSYVPGRMTAVIGDGCLALVDGPPDSPAVSRIWQQFGQRARANAILGGLLSAGFAGAESFVLLAPGEDGRPRLFCRGPVRVAVLGGAVAAWPDGSGLSTWSEHAIAADSTRVVVGEPSSGQPWELPASAGVLLAECVIVDLARSAGNAAPPGQAAPGPGQEPGPGPAKGGFAVTDSELPDPETVRTVELRARTIPTAVDTATIPPDPDPDPAPGRVLPASASPPGGQPGPPSVPLIDAVPWATGGSSASGAASDVAGHAPDSAADDAPDSATVRRGGPGPAARSAPDRIAPLVPALVCFAGHANPPSVGTCRWCGTPLPHEIVSVPRPVLGVLRLSLGDVITLDRAVLMGRNPSADHDTDGPDERPHVVKLPSADGDISRTHLKVTLDGWHVLVTDLNSTNGTLVELPGRDPQQLRPGEPMPILHGTLVTLAPGIDFRFEASS